MWLKLIYKTMGKTIIMEGRYDSATNKVVKDIMKVIKKSKNYPTDGMVHISLPHDLENTEEYVMEKANIVFSVEVNITREEKTPTYVIESFSIPDEDILEFNISINPNSEPQIYPELMIKLQEDVRHEMEHLLQGLGRGDRPAPENRPKDESTYNHHSSLEEVPAMVQGFYRKAKKLKIPLDDVMNQDLEHEVKKNNISQMEADKLLNLWTLYAKRRLPAAVYRNK